MWYCSKRTSRWWNNPQKAHLMTNTLPQQSYGQHMDIFLVFIFCCYFCVMLSKSQTYHTYNPMFNAWTVFSYLCLPVGFVLCFRIKRDTLPQQSYSQCVDGFPMFMFRRRFCVLFIVMIYTLSSNILCSAYGWISHVYVLLLVLCYVSVLCRCWNGRRVGLMERERSVMYCSRKGIIVDIESVLRMGQSLYDQHALGKNLEKCRDGLIPI